MPRLAGKQGAVYLGTSKIADIFNITLEVEMELAEASIKLEVHEIYVPGRVTSRLTGERYITDSATSIITNPEVGGSVMAKNLAANLPAAGNNYLGATVTWFFHTIAGAANNTATLGFNVTGEGFLERVTQQNPRGAASEVWEIRNTNATPTFTG